MCRAGVVIATPAAVRSAITTINDPGHFLALREVIPSIFYLFYYPYMTAQTNGYILTLNGGSSSLKFSLYRSASLQLEWTGFIDFTGAEKAHFQIRDNAGKVLDNRNVNLSGFAEAVSYLLDWLTAKQTNYPLLAIGHRLVQGGPEHREPELITEKLLKTLAKFIYLAPNHLPDELATIKAFQSAFPEVPQVACFDTAFHRDMPSYAQYYPLPKKYCDLGLLKYGFHGLSYQYILQCLTTESKSVSSQKIIIAHLGNGASMAAVKNGISVDTTMGVSPIGGLVMGTRSGDLDPGVLLFLLKQDKLTPNQLDELLSKASGLKAIAGKSDVQELLKAEAHDPKAAEALTVFCYSARKFIGALAAAMGGLDLLVFTGGIGEHSAVIRERICKELEFIGIELNAKQNAANVPVISKNNTRVVVRVIPTNEELMIARLTGGLLNGKNEA
jgi:acetate kinase